MRNILALTGMALLASCATAERDAQRNVDLVEARAVGSPQNCVQLTDVDHTRVRDDRTIDFVMRNRDVYRNTLPARCPGLGFNERFSYKTHIGQLCSVDVITVLDSGTSQGATCGLGQFQKVQLPSRS